VDLPFKKASSVSAGRKSMSWGASTARILSGPIGTLAKKAEQKCVPYLPPITILFFAWLLTICGSWQARSHIAILYPWSAEDAAFSKYLPTRGPKMFINVRFCALRNSWLSLSHSWKQVYKKSRPSTHTAETGTEKESVNSSFNPLSSGEFVANDSKRGPSSVFKGFVQGEDIRPVFSGTLRHCKGPGQ
jgi:hypothetical protein